MLSKLKKKLKPRRLGGEHKPGKTETDAGGEIVDPMGSLPRPGPHVVAGGGHPDVGVAVGDGLRREGDDADEEQVGRGYPSPPTPSLARGGKPDDGVWTRLF